MTYVSVKQLGGVISVATLETGDVVSTPAEIDTTRAIVFNQLEDNNAVCTLAAPQTSATPKLIHLTNQGDFPVTVQGVTLQPGPTYGIWWNGSAYSQIAVEGVGIVSNTQDSPSVHIGGDGSIIDPLTADVKISSALNNGLEIRSDGLYFQNVQIAPDRFVVVDTTSGSDTFDGTLTAPFKTISKAIQTVLNQGLILVVGGTYTEALQLPAGKRFVLEGIGGANDSNVVSINGIIRNDAGAAGIRFKNLTLHSPAGQGPAVEFVDAAGGMIFDNVSITSDLTNDQASVVHFSGGNSSWYVFNEGSIKGGLKVEGDNNAPVISLLHGAEKTALYINDVDATVQVSYQSYLGDITHLNGNLFLKSIAVIGNITSSANAPNLLGIHDSSLFDLDTGGWKTLTKTGTAPYTLDLKRAATNNAFSGTPLFGPNASDIHGNYAPVAYTATSDSVAGHLEGIDEALANVGGGLSAVTSTDSATVDFSGAGTGAQPLTAAVKVSSNAGNVLQAETDGLFVAAADVGLTAVSHANTDTIDITGDGTPSDPLQAEVSISTTAHNLLTKDTEGLFVIEPSPLFETVINIPYMWGAGEVIYSYKASREYTLAQGLAGWQRDVVWLDDPDSPDPDNPDPLVYPYTITIKKKNSLNVVTTIGTIDWNTGVTFPAAVQFTVGDVLYLEVNNEARFKSFALTILAQRPYTN
ncbi:putative tail fiber protein [Rhizobium phage RHEph12]|nr:putative tail fiber protein [Rhizobium phage RHEph12]